MKRKNAIMLKRRRSTLNENNEMLKPDNEIKDYEKSNSETMKKAASYEAGIASTL